MNEPMATMVESLFTVKEIRQARIVIKTHEDYEQARVIQQEIIEPIMDRIDKDTGQENNSKYMAYMLQAYCTLVRP